MSRSPGKHIDVAARLMSEFAARTGLVRAIEHPRRYLWTDAFAVCNFLELSARTGEQEYRDHAILLIDQVHHVLGRYRGDDARSGWISGFDEEKGRRHPTAGGLRIGKALKERGDAEPFDERLEWDRDGQYFHYLTKWMHALCQTSLVESKPAYARWAGELASAAYQGFGAASASHRGLIGIYWKMSTDLSRPLVFAMSSHDVLDGFITFREVQNAMTTASGAEVNIREEIQSLAAPLTQDRSWATDDPLGLGGLLFDAGRLCRLSENSHADAKLLEALLDGCSRGLASFLRARPLARRASHRLAFRELGLAIGLKAVASITSEITRRSFDNSAALRRATDWLLRHELLGAEIIDDWLSPACQQDDSWRAHQDINDVMLATALIPDTFLSIGRPVR